MLLYRLSKNRLSYLTELRCQDTDIALQQAKLLVFDTQIKNS